ncbi:MAG: pantoate--beta-alanine ligase, partial [Gloeobacteraceae cyanobacterium ES-bin-316]|nr:pantoate--beta-alanine ligase [Ferruginibacter sp.]
DLSKVSMEAAQYLTGEGFAVDYVEIASAADLTPVMAWDGKQKLVALIAASLKDVRLIDNLLLN